MVFEYKNDDQFLADTRQFVYMLTKDEWNVMLNHRACAKDLTCLSPECEESIWAVDNEVLTINNVAFKLLVCYTCMKNHHQYEVIRI